MLALKLHNNLVLILETRAFFYFAKFLKIFLVLEVRFPCDQCEYIATRKDKLNHHVRTKHEGHRYSCTQCSFQATRPDKLRQHTQAKHEGIIYPCDHCDYFAKRHDNLISHLNAKHKTNGGKAGTIESNKDSFISAPTASYNKVNFPCEECDFTAKYFTEMILHKESKHSSKKKEGTNNIIFQANGFTNKRKLSDDSDEIIVLDPTEVEASKPKKSKMGNKPIFSCDQCDYTVSRYDSLRRHISAHHEGIRYPCQQCEYTATRMDKLNLHIKTKHEGMENLLHIMFWCLKSRCIYNTNLSNSFR